jgi:hypothetical protein
MRRADHLPDGDGGSTQVVVTAEVISPHGVTTTANLYITVFA